jgi:hypothetical protein
MGLFYERLILIVSITSVVVSVLFGSKFGHALILPYFDPNPWQGSDSYLKFGSWSVFPTVWAPEDCILHSNIDLKTCFYHNEVKPKLYFVGDSTARQVFWGAIRTIDKFERESETVDYTSYQSKKHSNFHLSFNHVDVHFFWDPFFNSSGLEVFTKLVDNTKTRPEDIGLVYTSIGMWFSRWYESGKMETEFDQATQLLLTQYAKLGQKKLHSNTLFVAPILYPSETLLNDDRKSTIKHDELVVLNKILQEKTYKYSPVVLTPVVFNSFSNQHMDSTGFDSTGLHFSNQLCDKQAELLLNLRCNTVTDPGTQYCGSSTQVFNLSVLRILLVTILLGFCLQVYRHILKPATIGFTFLVLYLISNGPFIGRTLGSGFGSRVCEVAVFWVVMILSYRIVRDQHFPLNTNQNTPILIFRGSLLIFILLSMMLWKNSIVSYTLCNILVALTIITNTSQYFNHKAKSPFTISEVVKSLICDYGVVIVVSVITVPRSDRSFLFKVFETPTECFLLLGLYSGTAWAASVLSHKFTANQGSIKSLTMLLLGAKLFIILVTRIVFPSTFKWCGFEFLDLVALKFGLTLHRSSNRHLLKFLTLSGTVYVCTLFLLNSILKTDLRLKVISGISKSIFISSAVAYPKAEILRPISSVRIIWLEKMLIFLGKIDFVIASLATSVFFQGNSTIPVILSPTMFGFLGQQLDLIVKITNGAVAGAILLFTSVLMAKLTASGFFGIYRSKSNSIFEFEDRGLELLS